DTGPGSVLVARGCPDRGTCFSVVPSVFEDAGPHSRVHRQPRTDAERREAQRALVACPTASIGTDDKAGMAEAARDFPLPIEDEVSFCGYTSEKSFGAWSYFVLRPDGNVLVDSPRAAGPLMDPLEAKGGVRYHFLTHRDDVADHELFHRRFGGERVMHRDDGLRGLERYVEGGDPTALAPDLLLIPTPGHTAGSCCLLYR